VFSRSHLGQCLAIVCALLGLSTPETALAESQPPVVFDRVMEHVRVLTEEIGARPTSSANAQRAAEYIERRLESLGLKVSSFRVGTVDAPAVTVAGRRMLAPQRVTTDDRNLLVRFAPATGSEPGEPILLMAHYDSMSTTPGAVDNAAAVGLLLELARHFAESPPARPVVLAWPAAEETRLAGSRALAEQLQNEIGLAVALDLIGSPGTLTLNGLSSLLGQDWLEWLASAARKSRVEVAAPMPHRVVSRHLPQIERSDHSSFTERGIPAFHIYNRGPDRIYLPYHGPLDTAERIDAAAILDAAHFLLAIAMTDGPLPDRGGAQGFWMPFPGGPLVISTLALVLLEALLALAAVAGLAELVHDSDRRPRARGFGLSAALVVYPVAWLLVSVCLRIAEHTTEHPAPWAHAPLRFEILLMLIAGSVGMVGAWLVTLRRPTPGQGRYLALAIVITLLAGLTCIAVGAPEIAWTTLWISAAFGGLAWTSSLRMALPIFALSLLPLVGALDPGFLREGLFNGFWPASMPLSAYLAVLLLPHALALVYLFKRFVPPLPHRGWAGRAAIAVPVVIALVAAIALAAPSPRCSGREFARHGLTCELR